MAGRIEDYAVIGDEHTAALVGRDGSIDWLCLPRFDSPACFASLLGDEENGHWRIGPCSDGPATSRTYVDDTLVLESIWETHTGTVKITDFMPQRDECPDVVRIVEGVSGSVQMESRLRLRFDYGRRIPWVHRIDGQIAAVGGPDAVYLSSDEEMRGEEMSTVARFTIAEGQRSRFVLTWHESHLSPPEPVDADDALEGALSGWRAWSGRCTDRTRWSEAVIRSLITLKALTYGPTGGLVAATTTSLPEDVGGVRNWDYRYCWLRDATWTLEALVRAGYLDEAAAWESWLLRAVAGSPKDVQIMYGVAGERRLAEYEADWLPGYEDSTPVRIGNAAAGQLQLDVFGEVIDALTLSHRNRVPQDRDTWSMLCGLIGHLDTIWRDPDDGLWEVRGGRRHFTHSKVMCWVAYDRMSTTAGDRGEDELARQWRETADEIHALVCDQAYDEQLNTFTQSFGSTHLDAACLMIPRVGFLPPDDARVIGTVEAIQQHLTVDGLVQRYQTGEGDNLDSLPGQEGAFLACSFWLSEALQRIGRTDDAVALFERLLTLRNDLGLLAEEYDVKAGRLVGNFPQAFSHIGLVNTAFCLENQPSPLPATPSPPRESPPLPVRVLPSP